MSVNAQYIKCDHTGLSDDEIVKGLAVVHENGTKGWRVAVIVENDCDKLTQDTTCNNTNKGVMAVIRERLYFDSCGQMVMIFFNTNAAS